MLAGVLGGAGAYVWVKLFDMLVERNILDQKLSRKLVHISTGPVFVCTWPLYSASPVAPLVACAVPFINFFRLMLTGAGVVKDQGLVKSMSRTGNDSELLRGPLFYVMVLLVVTGCFWRTSIVGLVALSMMCGGDGLADIVGRRLGQGNPLPYNSAKSVAGSLAMLVGGAGLALLLIASFNAMGFVPITPQEAVGPVLGAALASTLVESLPINTWLDDNFSVPFVAGVTCLALESMLL